MAAHRAELVRAGLGHRPRLVEPGGGDAVVARRLRAVRGGVLLPLGDELVAPGRDAGFPEAVGNGEVGFVSEADERELRPDRLRELWELRRRQVREQARIAFEDGEREAA